MKDFELKVLPIEDQLIKKLNVHDNIKSFTSIIRYNYENINDLLHLIRYSLYKIESSKFNLYNKKINFISINYDVLNRDFEISPKIKIAKMYDLKEQLNNQKKPQLLNINEDLNDFKKICDNILNYDIKIKFYDMICSLANGFRVDSHSDPMGFKKSIKIICQWSMLNVNNFYQHKKSVLYLKFVKSHIFHIYVAMFNRYSSSNINLNWESALFYDVINDNSFKKDFADMIKRIHGLKLIVSNDERDSIIKTKFKDRQNTHVFLKYYTYAINYLLDNYHVKTNQRAINLMIEFYLMLKKLNIIKWNF